MNLAETVYQITEKFPSNERWGLVPQMRRSAVSVPSNIAEGYGRRATGDYRHHLSIARGSLLELETQVILCQRLKYIKIEEIDSVLNEIEQISKMLATLITKIR